MDGSRWTLVAWQTTHGDRQSGVSLYGGRSACMVLLYDVLAEEGVGVGVQLV